MRNIQERYIELVDTCPNIVLKGKKNLYTSANGHMFSQINKDGQLGIRFSKEVQEKYIKEFNSDYFRSYGAVMKGYVLIPNELWDDMDRVSDLLMEGHEYVLGLTPK